MGRMKCERAIALADCHTLVLAGRLKGTALFAHREDDLARKMKRKPFPVKVIFLESLERPNKPFGMAKGSRPYSHEPETKHA